MTVHEANSKRFWRSGCKSAFSLFVAAVHPIQDEAVDTCAAMTSVKTEQMLALLCAYPLLRLENLTKWRMRMDEAAQQNERLAQCDKVKESQVSRARRRFLLWCRACAFEGRLCPFGSLTGKGDAPNCDSFLQIR